MAAATRGQGDGTSSGSGIQQTSAGRALLTFELDRKSCVPLEQIKEILGCTAGMAALGDGPVMGIAVSGGRSIAVLNLSRLVGWAEKPAQEGASILVVESGTDLVGVHGPASLRH